jgi:hypothetical protein
MFKRHPSKLNMINRYYSTDDVIKFMNQDDLKVSITDRNEYVIEKNYNE